MQHQFCILLSPNSSIIVGQSSLHVYKLV